MYNGFNVLFTNDRFGTNNSALSFKNGYYKVPNGTFFAGDFSITLWIKINKMIEWAPILDFGIATKYNVYLTPSEKFPNSGKPRVDMYDSSGTGFYRVSSKVLSEGVWYFLVLRLNGTTANFYINGTQTDTFTNFRVPAIITRTTNFIGADNFHSPFLQSDIDDLRIYNRAINETEIKILFNEDPLNAGQGLFTTPNSQTITENPSSAISITQSRTEITTMISNMSLISKITTASVQSFYVSSLNEISPSEMLNILNTNNDFNSCLLNCSNRGDCKFNQASKKFSCECFSSFTGPVCEVNLWACFSSPCLNNGLCVQNSTNSSYQCKCAELFEGDRCEVKKNLCANETCSRLGVCIELYNRTKCNCLYLYEGDKCEIKNDILNRIEKVVKTSVVIAMFFLALLWVLVILSDSFNFFFKDKAIGIKKNKVVTKAKYIS